MSGGDEIYTEARLYDIAFGYRDFDAEAALMLDWGQRFGPERPKRVLELAAGPGGHGIAFARAGVEAICLDRSAEMKEYALARAAEAGVTLDYRLGDMRRFTLEKPVDLACLALDSVSHLLANDDAIACFKSVAAALVPGGLFILETPHPAETFGIGDMTLGAWKQEADDASVLVEWGRPGDRFDPIAQVRYHSVAFSVRRPGEKKRLIESIVPQRRYTAQELMLIGEIAGLKLVTHFGALDEEIGAQDHEEAFRLVTVLARA
ncbi:class I SAM-dependent methyltransferase [Radicibacter daui]|uniref:class I SAM-dependent methyltransferase n=1 Tax=Radicibacter daui TaxID=3064829 RepID=UPI004046B459